MRMRQLPVTNLICSTANTDFDLWGTKGKMKILWGLYTGFLILYSLIIFFNALERSVRR